MHEAELQAISQTLEAKSPQDVLAYAIERYHPRLILACSFGAEDVVLVDMIHRMNRDVPLFYLDTDFLFPETYRTRDRIVARYALKPAQIIQVRPLITPERQAAEHGDQLWTTHPDRCCQIRKVEPLTRVLEGYEAWVTGIRRDQAPTRANAGLIEWDRKFGLVKVNPLARWRWSDVWSYIKVYEVPYNELHDRNYPSVGCIQCTAPVAEGDDPRSGRWKNSAKTECGLHK